MTRISHQEMFLACAICNRLSLMEARYSIGQMLIWAKVTNFGRTSFYSYFTTSRKTDNKEFTIGSIQLDFGV